MKMIAIGLLTLAFGAQDDVDPRLKFLKSLEGTWVVTGEEAGPMKGNENTWTVVAGGSAVLERIFVGTKNEMITVYHMDGKELVATHYCLMKNAPRLKAGKKIVEGKLTFECTGVANTTSHDDAHMHGTTLRLDEKGVLHQTAGFFKDGKSGGTHGFRLERKKD